jgi:hypothetical protein
LTVISKLYFEGLIFDTGKRALGNEREATPTDGDGAVPSLVPGGNTSIVPSSAGTPVGRLMAAAAAAEPLPAPRPHSDPRRTWDYEKNQESGAHERPQRPSAAADSADAAAAKSAADAASGSPERTLRGLKAAALTAQDKGPAQLAATPSAPAGAKTRALTPRYGESPQLITGERLNTLRPSAEALEPAAKLQKTRRKPRRRRRASLITSPGLLTGIDAQEAYGLGGVVPGGADESEQREHPERFENSGLLDEEAFDSAEMATVPETPGEMFAPEPAPAAFAQGQRSPSTQSRTDIPVQRAPSAVPPAAPVASASASAQSRTDIPAQRPSAQSRTDIPAQRPASATPQSRTDIPAQRPASASAQSRTDIPAQRPSSQSRTDIPAQRPASAMPPAPPPPPPPGEARAASSQSRTDLPAQRAPSAMPPAVPADARATGGRARRDSSTNVRVSTTQLLATNGSGNHEDANDELNASLQLPVPPHDPPPRDRWSRPGMTTLPTMPVVPPPRPETQPPQRADAPAQRAEPAADAQRKAEPAQPRTTSRPRSKFEPPATGNEVISSERPEQFDPVRALPVRRPGRAIGVVLGLAVLLVIGALIYRSLFPEDAGAGHEPAATHGAPPAAEPAPQPQAPAAEPAAPTAPALPSAQDQGTAAPAPVDNSAQAAPVGASEVESVLAEAKALEQQGKPQAALKLYERAAALDPNSSAVLSHLAFGYLNRGDNQQAADFAARAVAIDPTSSEGWIVLGAARDALGDGKAARDAYRKCVELGQGDYVQECRRVAR